MLSFSLRIGSWCHVPEADFDFLYDTRGSSKLTKENILYAIGFLRELIGNMIIDEGHDAHYGSTMMKIVARGIILTIFDQNLVKHTFDELQGALDVMLLCTMEKNFRTEVHGTLFTISNRSRFASVAIRKYVGGGDGNGTLAES
ncbi:MAG: hypothetical protein Q9218_000236 [Villophora microphyllina]